MIKNLIKGLLFVLIFMLIVFVTRKNSLTIPVVLLMYYIVGLKSPNYKQLFLLILPVLIVWMVHLFDKDSLKSIVIFYLFFIPVVSYIGYLLNTKKLIIKILLPLLFIPLGGVVYSNWFEFYENFDARVNVKIPEILLNTEKGDTISLNTFENKIIVLDFWTTSCGICFKKFPEYEKVFLEYRDNPEVQFYAVNIPIKDEAIDSNIEFAKKEVNYQFENLYAESVVVMDSMGFNTVPHLIILKDSKIRYSGRLITDIKTHNIRGEINRLLKE